MDGGQDRDFLLEVAEKVNEMVADSSKMERFRQQIKAFDEALQEEGQEYDLYEGKLLQYAKESAKNPRLRNKEKGPPKKGWIWKDDFTLDEVPKGFWMPAIKEPTLSRHYSIELSKTSDFAAVLKFIVGVREIRLSEEEALQACYVLLTVIHDMVFEYNQRVEPINDDIWEWNSEEGYLDFGSLWQEMRDKSADEIVQADIKHVLHKVEADLKKPVETGQDITGAIIDEKTQAKTIGSINIQNFKGVLGDVQAEDFQIADDASIQKQAKPEWDSTGERGRIKKIAGWIFKKMWYLIGAVIVSFIGTILIDIFGDFGWIERIKTVIYNILRN